MTGSQIYTFKFLSFSGFRPVISRSIHIRFLFEESCDIAIVNLNFSDSSVLDIDESSIKAGLGAIYYLEKKDRYWIGTLTFFLTLTYIIYLIFIRAINSIVLSINAFSTLCFWQIPVRGFTKYVAIIEGFIGWYLLSVFIVSLLSQMMSV